MERKKSPAQLQREINQALAAAQSGTLKTKRRLLLHPIQMVGEVPVRGGGFAIPVHGIDDEGFARDPYDEAQPRRLLNRRVDQAIKAGKSSTEVFSIINEMYARYPQIAT